MNQPPAPLLPAPSRLRVGWMVRAFAAVFAMTTASLGAERWAVGVAPTDPARGWISISPTGFRSLSEAILQFPTEAPGARLSHIDLGRILDHDMQAQKELMDHLRKHHPKELSAAMKSAGNMHNPAIQALRKPFQEALMATSFVSGVQAALAKADYRLSGIRAEKLTLDKPTNTFSAGIWLMVE